MPGIFPDLRDDLFDQLKYGKITPDEAEAEALRLGLEPLRRVSTNDDFNPIREAQWTLPMAVAWIAYRTRDAVREWWPHYREQCWDWWFRKWRLGFDGDVYEGWFLEQRPPATMSLLLIGDALERTEERDPKFSMRAGDARDALWVALSTDCFRATGIDQESGQRVQILPITWTELKCYEENDPDELRPNALQQYGPNRYRDVLLPSASLRGLWRAPFIRQVQVLPAQVAPGGDGYMPLYCAAQWIATEGGRRDFDPEDVEIWRPTFVELLAVLSSEMVRVVGIGKDGLREPVAGHFFAGLQVDYPFNEPTIELFMGEEFYLRSYPYDDEDDWRGGFSDAITNRQGDYWGRLMVNKADVAKRWPFDQSDMRTGVPGRPALSAQLISDELERRGAEGALEATLRAQAKVLIAWLTETSPKHARPTLKTVENRIRDRYRELRAPK